MLLTTVSQQLAVFVASRNERNDFFYVLNIPESGKQEVRKGNRKQNKVSHFYYSSCNDERNLRLRALTE